MSNRRQRWHLERSVVTLNVVRAQGLTYPAFEATVADEREPLSKSQRQSLKRLWGGTRPLRFEETAATTSELAWFDSRYADVGYSFFHPLWTLFGPPLRSSEKSAMKRADIAPWLVADDEEEASSAATSSAREAALRRLAEYAAQRARLARSLRWRSSRAQGRPTMDLSVVHCAMLQLRKPLRDALMEPSRIDARGVAAIDVPWVRRSLPIRDTLQSVRDAPRLIDRLAATLALALEAALVGREREHLDLLAELRRLETVLRDDAAFQGVWRQVARGVRASLGGVAVLETSLVQAQLAALPDSWRDPAMTQAMGLWYG